MTAPLQILFVDDDLVFCEYFQTLVKPYNLSLDIKHTFEEARKAIEAGKTGAYIIDANLPDGSGYDLVSLVRQKYGDQPPIVVISGMFKDSDHFNKLKESLKVNYVIDKPIPSDAAHRLLYDLCHKEPKAQTLEDALARLKQKYDKMIPSIVAEVERLILNVKEKGDEVSLKELKQNVHKIAGSAGSAGYPSVSILCKRWEQWLIKKLEAITTSSFTLDDRAELDAFFAQLKFEYQVAPAPDREESKSSDYSENNVKRLPLYVVDSDRSWLASLERERADFNHSVLTEWDPEKALKWLSRESFSPRIVIVGETFRASPILGIDLIRSVQNKQNQLPTSFGIILDKEDFQKRADAIKEGITYVLEKPISGKLLLDTIKGSLHFEEHPELKVLIVDDDPFVCEFISSALSQINVSHKSIGDGGELFNLIKEYKPNILLLDIYMPGYNGVELLKTMRSDVRFNNIMIVIITSSQDSHLLSEAYKGNVDDILHKPLDSKIIQTRILSLGKKQAFLKENEKKDHLTGLPNQTAFKDYIHERLLNTEYSRVGVYLGLIELDQVSILTDPKIVDKLLSDFSNMLVAKEKQVDYEAYLGRGRFAIVSEATDLHSFKTHIENFLETAGKELSGNIATHEKITFSCGLTPMPIPYTSQEQVLHEMESTLLEAKQLGSELPIKLVSHPHDGTGSTQKRKIIIIDQDEDLQQILRTSFESRGFEVVTYNLGEPFLEDLFTHQNPFPPLVITERLLPDMDGIDLLNRLHKRYPIQLPVMFLSSLSSDKDVLDGLKAGALDYITKPFNLHQMVQKSIMALSR